MGEGKQLVPDRYLFDLLESRFPDLIDKDGLVIDEDALTGGMPNEYPSLPEDPAERKKVFTEYIMRVYGASITTFKQARKNIEAREKFGISSSLGAAHNITTMMAAEAAGSDELKNDYNLQK